MSVCEALYCSPSIRLASAGEAISRPSSRESRTTLSTSSPLLFAGTPRERYRLSSKPTRTFPPITIPAAAIVKAVTNYTDAALIARLSENLGEAMVGINKDEIELLMAERGK